MLNHIELDPTLALFDQFENPINEPVVLINMFNLANPNDTEHFKRAWQEDAEFFKAQPGYISAQLHHGIGDSQMWMNYAVFESAQAFGATTRQPQFKPLRAVYPDSATAHPHLFRRVRIPGICTG